MYRILITGANGQLGSEFRKIAPGLDDYRLTFTDVGELNIVDSDAVTEFMQGSSFDVIINCAGYTAVDQAESDRDKAMQVNALAVRNLAHAASRQNAMLVHISTDYVFDGHSYRPYRETDREKPLSWYGITKLEGERQVLMHAGKALIIRTSWLYSPFGKNFLRTILEKGRQQEELRVVCDQTGTPTCAADLAGAILHILPQYQVQEKRIYNYSSEGICSWYDFAKEIVDMAGLSCRVVPVPTAEWPTPASRPFYSVLDKGKIKRDFGMEIPYWKESLKKCLEEINNNNPSASTRLQTHSKHRGIHP
ncbi:MAG TPA: dTDP-4-dehydrorhamnose reductase [Bacteroidales bacterium]|nr:dTDP-4-dehydrorhamnose reductase [Bacteroidales bacterium]